MTISGFGNPHIPFDRISNIYSSSSPPPSDWRDRIDDLYNQIQDLKARIAMGRGINDSEIDKMIGQIDSITAEIETTNPEAARSLRAAHQVLLIFKDLKNLPVPKLENVLTHCLTFVDSLLSLAVRKKDGDSKPSQEFEARVREVAQKVDDMLARLKRGDTLYPEEIRDFWNSVNELTRDMQQASPPVNPQEIDDIYSGVMGLILLYYLSQNEGASDPKYNTIKEKILNEVKDFLSRWYH